MKVCRRCCSEKTLSEFNSRVIGEKTTYHSYCRPCLVAYKREWAAANPAVVREQKRRYRTTHREEIRQYKHRQREEKGERIREQERLWRRLHPEEVATRNALYSAKRRQAQLLRDHNLSLGDFVALWESQDGRCAICQRPIAGDRLARGQLKDGEGMSHVDHDHRTGAVRGLLCYACNPALGLLQDSPDLLRAAATYLESAPLRRIPKTPPPGKCKPWDFTITPGIQPKEPLRPNHGKTHCPAGHPYEGDNLYVDPRGYRKCRTCVRERYEKAKAARDG